MTDDKTPRPGSDPTDHQIAAHVVDEPLADETDQTVVSSSPPLAPQTTPLSRLSQELAASMVGEQIGDIRLEQLIGGGGMGVVFRGLDTNLDRTVAVKILAARPHDDAESLRRFQVEARSAARLDHPNIARVHYVDEERGLRYLVFEYIRGANIRDLVHANGPFPLADALRYMLQIADALLHASQREVVHRDIKPSNILITPDGQAKLVDMGLARFAPAEPAEQDHTASGVTLGTFDYMAPEQARDSRLADVRSDIYSLGCTLFFMLAGEPPFPEGSALQKLLQHQSDAPPDVHQYRADVPESLAELLDTMLAKQPEDRFQNPSELMAALIAVTEQLGLVHPQVSLPAAWMVDPNRASWLRRHAPWLVAAALLAAIVLGLGIAWSRDQAPPDFPELRIPDAPASSAEQ
jgi:serine/threonine-protein kinase